MKITDDRNEIFDVVDENDKVIGQAKRGEAHGDNKLIHRSIGVLVFNSKGEIFLQHRSATKDTDPLKWTISCSGHVNSKPKNQKLKIKNTDQNARIYETTAHRELIEELGIDLEIKPVAKYIWRSKMESETVMLFRAVSDGPFKLHPLEICEGRFFTRNELFGQMKSDKLDLNEWAYTALAKIGWNFLDKTGKQG